MPSITISWPAVSGATGYTTRLTVPRIGTDLHNSGAGTTSFNVTLKDGDFVHQETISSGVDSSYTKDFVVGASPALPSSLTATVELIPGLITLSGLTDINPGGGSGESQAAAFNGIHTTPDVQTRQIVPVGVAKFNGVNKNFFIKYSVLTGGSLIDFTLLYSENGGITGAPAFLSNETSTFNIETGVWSAVNNDDSSGFAQGGTMQLHIPNYNP